MTVFFFVVFGLTDDFFGVVTVFFGTFGVVPRGGKTFAMIGEGMSFFGRPRFFGSVAGSLVFEVVVFFSTPRDLISSSVRSRRGRYATVGPGSELPVRMRASGVGQFGGAMTCACPR